ncbi:MAG: CPBP family intramembrane metalloprotease [Calothrix sp. FI2-JRJ7]|jgi:hypothetical protein|nr:CPBP family intramembrane metalloprotease [Calothrix sp. FI2-JRJ7]
MLINQQKLHKFAQRYPIKFVLTIFIFQHLPVIGIILCQRLAPNFPMMTQRIVLQVILAIYAVILLTNLKWWHKSGFNSFRQWRSLHLLWLPLLFVVLYFSNGIIILDFNTVAFVLSAQLLTGFSEEAIFRGVILRALLPSGVMRATLISSLLFGLSHWVRLLFDLSICSILLTILSATVDGFLFAAIRLRTNTIWTAILFHALANLLGDFTLLPAYVSIALSVGGSVALFIYAIYLLRPFHHARIL